MYLYRCTDLQCWLLLCPSEPCPSGHAVDQSAEVWVMRARATSSSGFSFFAYLPPLSPGHGPPIAVPAGERVLPDGTSLVVWLLLRPLPLTAVRGSARSSQPSDGGLKREAEFSRGWAKSTACRSGARVSRSSRRAGGMTSRPLLAWHGTGCGCAEPVRLCWSSWGATSLEWLTCRRRSPARREENAGTGLMGPDGDPVNVRCAFRWSVSWRPIPGCSPK